MQLLLLPNLPRSVRAGVPDGSVDDLVEQVVVQVGGRSKTQKLHGERGDEA